MSIRTGVCKHCGKKKEEHYCDMTGKNFVTIEGSFAFCKLDGWSSQEFSDSGLASLHEHAEELYGAILKEHEAYGQYQFFLHGYRDGSASISEVTHSGREHDKAQEHTKSILTKIKAK